MAAERMLWRRGLLITASVVLSVAVSVAGNQVLNDGVWNGWWALIALALGAAATAVAYRLTDASSSQDRTAGPSGAASSSIQSVMRSSASGDIVQAHDLADGIRIAPGASTSAAPIPAPASPAMPVQEVPDEEPTGSPGIGQSVTGSIIGGSIIQISGAGGDVTIERS
ncbi:hypothetical protein ACFQVD_32720 [Streptosporangium amethystogenes subsp. fukuiense]|uniref:Phage holin family protein n=1 Tax=Streptosporangium amethystogenes subsp. fukuiense TaxID=698418 RepID=A0ABW2T8V6_9ACTN